MDLKDTLVSGAIEAAQDKLHGEAKDEKTSFGGAVLRFFISLIWLIITLAVLIVAFYTMAAGDVAAILGFDEGLPLCFIAIGLCLLIFLLTFIIPYLRKKGTMTRWCGIVALGEALWWIYILISGNM